MALLLNIDTATNTASVCISRDGQSIAYAESHDQKEHASFVHSAIQQILQSASVDLKEVDAIAVTSGPGSYTGVRVGLATAKGFCVALNKPLILINTLKVMAQTAMLKIPYMSGEALLCPMIDARRMEVFTAVYDQHLVPLVAPHAEVVDEQFAAEWFQKGQVYLFGTGSNKASTVISSPNAVFANINQTAHDLALLAENAFQNREFADVAYAEPEYTKGFYSTVKHNNGR